MPDLMSTYRTAEHFYCQRLKNHIVQAYNKIQVRPDLIAKNSL